MYKRQIEIVPASFTEAGLRVELFGDEIERLREVDLLTGRVLGERSHAAIFPATHYVTAPEQLQAAAASIEAELEQRLAEFRAAGKLLEAQRLEPVSYTHLDVYKRQLQDRGYRIRSQNTPEMHVRL